MAAYVILDITVHDPASYKEYAKQSGPALEQMGGRFLVRGGTVHPLEGNWSPQRCVVLEFDTVEQARAWYDSDLYAGPKKLRHAASTGQAIIVEGV